MESFESSCARGGNGWNVFGAIYDTNPEVKKKKLKFFVGKYTRQFLNDVDGYTVGLELDCLNLAIGSHQ